MENNHFGAGEAPDEASAVAELRHQFRNQIQSMTSLVSLFGDRVPAGPARGAFVDLRARLEATVVMHADEFSAGPDGRVRCGAMLAALAQRIAGFYETGRALVLDVRKEPFEAEPKRAATIAQLFAEMLIEFFRCPSKAGGPAKIVIAGTADALTLKIAGPVEAPSDQPDEVAALGRVILKSLAQSLGGDVSRDASDGYAISVAASGRTTDS